MVYKLKVKYGIVVVFIYYMMIGFMINEYESGLIEDFKVKMKELILKGVGYFYDRIDSNVYVYFRVFLFLNLEVVIFID